MKLELTAKEIEDIKRALYTAMKCLDATENRSDKLLSDRLEKISKKIDKLVI